jgi:hypothetical protein
MSETKPLYADPLIILAPGRCFSSVVCAMLGQHPQLFGLLETQLFARDTLDEWWEDFGSNVHAHGLCRSVAEITCGEQSPRAVKEARRWLWQRRNCTTGEVFAELAEQVYPLVLVEKTPMLSYRLDHMERAWRLFPDARFLHLVRHPVGYGRSLLEFFAKRGPRRPNQAAALLRNPESIFFGMVDESADPPVLDPQAAWYRRHSEVLAFTRRIPERQRMCVRGEDILAEPEATLTSVARWLGLRTDAAAIEPMKHPEQSPFACLGPWNARFGADPKFLHDPILRPFRAEEPSLEKPVPWREDGTYFTGAVRGLASQFGYT